MKEDVCDCMHPESSHFDLGDGRECDTCGCQDYNYYATGTWTSKSDTPKDTPLN